MTERVGTGELAKRLGISRQRVSDLAKEGKLTREPDGQWDVSRAMAELSQTLDNQQKRKVRLTAAPRNSPAPVQVDETDFSLPGQALSARTTHDLFNRARAAKEIALAKERQLDLRRREGELLEARQVEQAWTQKLTSFKNRLLAIPDRLAQKLAAISEDREVRAILDGEIKAALQALIEKKADAA